MAYKYPTPLVILTEYFARLPGIGMKTAGRLAYYVMSMENEDVENFARALVNVKTDVRLCRICQNLTEKDLCAVCEDDRRLRSVICVVETPKDILAFERSEYEGVYHVLHGLISPIDGITPDMIKIKELLKRLAGGEVKEIIMATNPTVEGEATAMYIAHLLRPFDIEISRLAFGLPIGGALEYADDMTLFKALENRTPIT